MKPKFKPSDIVRVIDAHISGRFPISQKFINNRKKEWEECIGTLCIIEDVSFDSHPFPNGSNYTYSVRAIKGKIPMSAWIDETCFELVSRHEQIQ